MLAFFVGLTAVYALSANETARDEGLLDPTLLGELRLAYAAAAVIAAAAVVMALVRSAATVPALLPVSAGVAAAGLLSLTSGQVREVAVFVALMAWSWYVGSLLLGRLDREMLLDGSARLAIEAGLGLVVLSYGVLAIALIGLATTVGLLALLAALPITLTLLSRPQLPPRPRLADFMRRGTLLPVEAAALALLAVALVASFGVSLAPQVQFDALHYHFAMPRFILDAGRFVERPDIVQSYFPLGLEMAYVPALRFGGESTMTLLHWAMAPLTIALVWGAADRFFGRPSGALAAGLCFLTPLVFVEASSASSDLAMVFWVLAAAFALALYASKPGTTAALLAGLFGGCALTFKLVSGIYILPLAAVFAVLLVVNHRRPSPAFFRDAGAFAAAGLILGSPWLLIRYVQTGNPVFPMYNNIFRSDKWEPIHERFDLWLYGIGHGAEESLRVWWEITANPSIFGQHLPPWSIGIGPLAFIAGLAAIPLLPRARGLALLFGLAVLFGLAWFLLSQYHRYGLPAYTLMGVAGAVGLAVAMTRLPQVAGGAVGAALLAVWAAVGLTIGLATLEPTPYPRDVVLGRESREAYSQRAIPNYDALVFVESVTVGTDESAAILGYQYNYFVGNRLYSMLEPAPLSTFRRILDSGVRGEALARALGEAGIRWLVVDYTPLFPGEWPPRYLAENVLSPEFLEQHTRQAFEMHNVVVYQLISR